MIETTSCPLCAAPAEVLDRYALESTDGPVEHVSVVCVRRHRFLMPAAGLPLETATEAVDARPRSPQDR